MLLRVASTGGSVFALVWFGQTVSLLGSGLTSFALGVWTFQKTGSITQFALIGLFAVLPRVLLSPLAGALVDRWDRRKAMIVSDLGAGLSTIVAALLLYGNLLDTWQIFILVFINGAFGAIQWPAYTAAISQLVPQKNLGRANGMVQLGQAIAEIFAPLLAGSLLAIIQLQGILVIDFATFAVAVLTLFVVRFPRIDVKASVQAGDISLWEEIALGWFYIWRRKGLFGLLVFTALVNFLWGMVGALIVPMILGFTSSQFLGGIISIAGLGLLAGSLAMSAWGGPQPLINGVLAFELFSGVCFMLIGLRPSFWLVAMGVFGAHLTIAIIYGSNQAIWQSKVATDVQGRVFAFQQMTTRATSPLAYALAGPLAENLFEPLLLKDGALSTSLGGILGIGLGRGIGLLFIIMGLIKMAVSLLGYLNPRIRLVEEELPDIVPGASNP